METICDGEPGRTVKCPQQNVISTVWATYGRNHPDTCVEGDQLINSTCNADYDTVLSMVQESCDDSNSCTLESSQAEYGDPPECQGVRKYLQMYYLCKSGERCSVKPLLFTTAKFGAKMLRKKVMPCEMGARTIFHAILALSTRCEIFN